MSDSTTQQPQLREPPRREPLLRVRDLHVEYAAKHGRLQALRGVSFDIAHGAALGIVGESGSGKSSLAKAILRLVPAASGSVQLDGEELLRLSATRLRATRRQMQMIFQDPLASLDPQMSIGEIIAEPLRVFEPELTSAQRTARVQGQLQAVGLSGENLGRAPREFSGGQAQRIAIARALICEPHLLLCDEPLSALDVSIRAQIANLLKDLQELHHLTLLFISHDLAAVRFLCDQVLVLYLGRVMEQASSAQLFHAPRHPYTRALLASSPQTDPAQAQQPPALAGEIPSPLNPPSGCVFRSRCPHAIALCADTIPALRPVQGSLVACHRAHELGGSDPNKKSPAAPEVTAGPLKDSKILRT